MFIKFFATLIILASCTQLCYSDTILNCKDYYSLMREVDKLHPPYCHKRKSLEKRDNDRRENVYARVSDALFKSDSIFIIIVLEPDEVEGSFYEYVCNDSVQYALYYGIQSQLEDNQAVIYYNALLRRIKEKKYHIIPYRPMTPDEDCFLFLKVKHIGEHSFSISQLTFFESVYYDRLFYVQEKDK